MVWTQDGHIISASEHTITSYDVASGPRPSFRIWMQRDRAGRAGTRYPLARWPVVHVPRWRARGCARRQFQNRPLPGVDLGWYTDPHPERGRGRVS
jgi:hypothetical protein